MVNTASFVPVSHNANGITTNFPFTFKIISEDDIVVILEDGDGNQTALTKVTDYSVTFTVGVDGGSITTVQTYASPNKIIISRKRPNIQDVDLTTSEGFRAETVERLIADSLSMQIQELAEESNRSVKKRVGQTGDFTLPNATTGKSLKWKADGTLENSTNDPDEVVSQAQTSATNAATSATNAANSASMAATSAINASTSEDNALTYRNEAEAFKNSLNLPTIQAGDAGKSLVVNSTEDGYVIGEVMPTGTVIQGYFSTAPAGFLKCNGAEYSRTTYADLYNHVVTEGIIGSGSEPFGIGDGSTTFTVPDDRAEFYRNWDDGRGVDPGRVLGSWQADELEAHTHTANNGSASHSGHDTGFSTTTGRDGGTSGSTGGAETRPRNRAVLSCVKY